MNSAIKEIIKKLARDNGPTVVKIKRRLHAHPVLSFSVTKTLKSGNIDVQEGMAETGLTALRQEEKMQRELHG